MTLANLTKFVFAVSSFAAHLHSGELVAVKVQWPGITFIDPRRTIVSYDWRLTKAICQSS